MFRGISHLTDEEVFRKYYNYGYVDTNHKDFVYYITPEQKENFEKRMACDRHLKERMTDVAGRFRMNNDQQVPMGTLKSDFSNAYLHLQQINLHNMCRHKTQFHTNNPMYGNVPLQKLYTEPVKGPVNENGNQQMFKFDSSVFDKLYTPDLAAKTVEKPDGPQEERGPQSHFMHFDHIGADPVITSVPKIT